MADAIINMSNRFEKINGRFLFFFSHTPVIVQHWRSRKLALSMKVGSGAYLSFFRPCPMIWIRPAAWLAFFKGSLGAAPRKKGRP
jgi:hypothetical protein